MTRGTLQAILLPAVVVGGYLLTAQAGGFIADAWDGFLGPFMITYWIGFGFTMAWDVAAESLHAQRASPLTMAIAGVLTALFMLSLLGGPAVLLKDPWLFGIAIAPGLRLAAPWLAGRKQEEGTVGDS